MPELPALRVDSGFTAVNFLSFTGQSPIKLADTIYMDGGSGMIFLTMAEQDDDYVTDLVGFTVLPAPGIDPLFHMKMQFPRMSLRGSRVDRIEVLVNGEPYQELQLLEDMERIAEETFQLRLPTIVAKTVVRAVAKAVAADVGTDVASDALEDQLGAGGAILGLFGKILVNAAVDASENADLRISHFFPSRAFVGEIIIEPGVYDFTINYYSGNTLLFSDIREETEIYSRGINLVESFYLQ
jgi:hypothetical protein